MEQQRFRYIYGPVHSWRLGLSLGIDPISRDRKICNFNCVYCQLGADVVLSRQREVFVPTPEIIREIQAFPADIKVDYLTLSGRGEPTLAKNLGEIIAALHECRRGKVAVITNAGLMDDPQVRTELMGADCVLAKLDACDQPSFERVDCPSGGQTFNGIVNGLRRFAQDFPGRLALQMMFIDANKSLAPEMARIAASIKAAEIELNTPLRPCGVAALSEQEMRQVQASFAGLPVTMVYDRSRKTVEAMDVQETRRRHGNYQTGDAV